MRWLLKEKTRLEAEGGTAMPAALQTAKAAMHEIGVASNDVMLFTDGEPYYSVMRLLPGHIQTLPFGRGQGPYVLRGHAILVGADADGENDI